MLASNRVIPTERLDTIKLLRVGVQIRPDSNNRTKLSKLQLSGSAKGSDKILTSDLNVPRKTIEHGTKISKAKRDKRKVLVTLYIISLPRSPVSALASVTK
jgi:hypothetical protein